MNTQKISSLNSSKVLVNSSVVLALVVLVIISTLVFFGQSISIAVSGHYSVCDLYAQIGTIFLWYILLHVYFMMMKKLSNSADSNVFECYQKSTEKTTQGFLLSRIALVTNIVTCIGVVILPFYFEFKVHPIANYTMVILFIGLCYFSGILSTSIFGFTSTVRLINDRYIDLYCAFFGKHTKYLFQEIIAVVYIFARMIYLVYNEAFDMLFSVNTLMYFIATELILIFLVILFFDSMLYLFDDCL